MSKKEQKQTLIEELGVHFEHKYAIPPLAARIYASLILSEQDGITFEDCLIKRGASKSSISTSLNLLLKMGVVSYFTKPGNRKRYFRLAEKSTFFLKKLEDDLKKIDNERTILCKIHKFNEVHNLTKYKENKATMFLFKNYLDENEKLLQTTIKELESLTI